MKNVQYYLDYMAQSFGVADYSALESQHLSIFKKYLSSCIEEWENMGDMDYLKHLGMFKTRAELSGTVTANLGSKSVTLSTASDAYALGCDLQINNKAYMITGMTSTTAFSIFPAYMDADTTTETFKLRYNRVPVPSYFKRILFRKMYYFESIASMRLIIEKDFTLVNRSNSTGDPQWFQIKNSTRDDGFSASGTISGTTVTVTTGEVTDYMAGLPFRTASLNETYYIRSITSSTEFELDRSVSTNVSVAEAFVVLPAGTMLLEFYPHPDESKQVVYDYLSTEINKQGLTERILAPTLVIEALLDIKLAKFSEDSASSRQLLTQIAEKKKEESKKKNVTDYTPSVGFFGGDLNDTRHDNEDYNGGDRGNFRGGSLRSRRL